MADPVCALNNYLQGPPNLTMFLHFTSAQEGPNSQAIHHGTYIYKGVTVGRGDGTSISQARKAAAVQAMQYFNANGIPE